MVNLEISNGNIMSKMLYDHPNIIIFPPIILVTTVLLGCLLQWLSPCELLGGISQTWRAATGWIVLITGMSLAALGRRALMRLGTNVSPLRPTTALATEGIFRWTRNPLYSGGSLMMFGIALVFCDRLVVCAYSSKFVDPPLRRRDARRGLSRTEIRRSIPAL